MKVENFNAYVLKDNKQIITDMNFELKKNDMLAILGPSGSGKTTLLDYLTCNFSHSLKEEGDVEIHGVVKYVSQEERLHGFYTVRDYLSFYFGLNYGLSVDDIVKNRIVEGIAASCGLSPCIDTIVGDIFFKGISGGQKRRLSIALEIISKPDIIIVDEPTSGLDSFSAYKVMELLKNLTKWGHCVICTIHQPSSEIWDILDKVMILSRGNTCYFGQADFAHFFFRDIGKPVPLNYNVADHILTHVNSDFDESIKPDEIARQFREWEKTFDFNNPDPDYVPISTNENKGKDNPLTLNTNEGNNKANTGAEVVLKRENSLHHDIEAIIPITKKHNEEFDSQKHVRKELEAIVSEAGWCDKFISILKRSFVNLVKNPGVMIVRLVMYIMLCFMIGVLYLNLGDQTNHQDIIARVGMLFYCDAFLVFMSIAVLPFYIIERGIVQKEVNNQLYHPLHYITSQFIVSIFGVATIAIVSTLFVVLLADLNGFGIFFVILFLSLGVAESLCRLVSLLVPHYIIGMALVAGIYGMFMLTEGFLIIKDEIPGYLIWLYYIGFHTYSFEGFMYNEFEPIQSFNSNQYSSGLQVLKFYSMDDTRIWMDCVILVAWSVALEIASLIVMTIKFSKKNHLKTVIAQEARELEERILEKPDEEKQE